MSPNRIRHGISLPIYNTKIGEIARLARIAEDAGFDSAWDYELYHDPYLTLALAAQQTDRIGLGTGLAVALNRSPFVAANAAADVDELSGGRMLLGLGAGGVEQLRAFHSVTLTQPLQRMREYVHCLRATWRYLADHQPASYDGKFFQLNLPPDVLFNREPVRERIPIYLAGVRPKMIQLAGEIGDGLLGYFQPVEFLRTIVEPNLIEGAKRAGRDPAELDMVTYIIMSVSKDRAEAIRRAKIHVGVYIAISTAADNVIEHYGLQRECDELRTAFMTEGAAALEKTDDKLVDAFSIAGTPDECRKKFAEYEPHLKHALMHTPATPPLTPEESEDAFINITETFGG